MDGYEKQRETLAELGVSVFAGSVDDEASTLEITTDINYPVAYGMSRETGEQFGAWWDEERHFIQPSEFFMKSDGKVLAATYSNSPIGRMEPEDAVALARFLIKGIKDH